MAAISGAATGVVANLLGMPLRQHAQLNRYTWCAVAAAGIVYASADLLGKRLPVPSSRWQVPAAWSKFGQLVFGALFGAVLGTGVLTVVPYVGFYLLLVICGLQGQQYESALTLAVFGLARGAVVLGTAVFAAPAGTGCASEPITASDLLSRGLTVRTEALSRRLLRAVALTVFVTLAFVKIQHW
jgi:hypothetical protein